ncbi:hypothetical protein CVT24_004778 [Panaeolus cyanescens]|uniref:Uncharacterized protein n=1 Tax=Panaeolus cyanescens TaxID=181874 RepID=A0A409V9V8_9AGAR|nr:hypothetical protein CVT24_004778 [Panaeolus cyanescens]
MARPPSFSVEEFQALISLTLDLKGSDAHEEHGHSRISSPNLLHELEYGYAQRFGVEERDEEEGEGDDFDDSVSVRVNRGSTFWSDPLIRRSRKTSSASPVQVSAGGGGIVFGRPNILNRSPAFPTLTPTTTPQRKRRFSLSTTSPSPAASHAASKGLLNKVNRAIRRISVGSSSSPNTPFSTPEKTHTSISGPDWKSPRHRRCSSNTYSTHTPTLSPTKEKKEEELAAQKSCSELEGEGHEQAEVDRLRSEGINEQQKEKESSRIHPHRWPSSWDSFDSIPYTHASAHTSRDNRDREYAPSTPSEPLTPITFEDSGVDFVLNRSSAEDMLAIAPVGTLHVEDVVGCLGSSSGDEGGSSTGLKRDKSREKEEKEKSRERRGKGKSRERSPTSKTRERAPVSNLALSTALNGNGHGATPSSATPSPTPTKLQFSFPLGKFSPSNAINTSSNSSGMSVGDISASSPISGSFGGEMMPPLEDGRGRKLSVLGRLKKGLNSMGGRGKGGVGVLSSPVAREGEVIGGGYPFEIDNNGVRRDSVLAKERDEMERDVDLRFVTNPSRVGSRVEHEEGAVNGREDEEGEGKRNDTYGSEESGTLSVEVARRAGEVGLPSVCVTFATSSASASSGSGCAGGEKDEGFEIHGQTGVNISSPYETPVASERNINGASGDATRTLSPRASLGTVSSASKYSCSSYIGSESSFFAADAIERERRRVGGKRSGMGREGGNVSSSSGGGNLSSSSGGGKRSMDGESFLSLDLSGSEGSASDDTSRGVGGGIKGRGGRKEDDMDGASFIEFGEDVDCEREGEGGNGATTSIGKRGKRGIGMTSTPPRRRDERGKKRSSVVLFRGTSSSVVSSANNNSCGDIGLSGEFQAHGRGTSGDISSDPLQVHQSSRDGTSSKAPSVMTRSDASMFSGSTHFEFAPVVGCADDDINGRRRVIHHSTSFSSFAYSDRHSPPFELQKKYQHQPQQQHQHQQQPHRDTHHGNHRPSQRRVVEPCITVHDVDAVSDIGSSIHAPSVDAMSVSTRSVDALSVDAMSVNSDDTDYIPYLPLVLQHERLQKTLRKPVSMEAVVYANETGRGVARSVRSVGRESVRSGVSGSGREKERESEEKARKRTISGARLNPMSAHAMGGRNKAAARLGIMGSETTLGGSLSSSSSKKKLPAHVSETIAGVCIPAPSMASRAPSICSSVGTEESVPARSGPVVHDSGMTLRVETDLDLDIGARRVVICGSGLDAGVEELRDGRVSMSSEDAGSVVVSDERHEVAIGSGEAGNDEEAFENTPTPTPRATVFAVDSLEVTNSGTSTPSTNSSKRTFIGPHQGLSPQPSVGSLSRKPSRTALKATPPRAPPLDPLPLPPLSPSPASSPASGSDNLLLTGAVSTRMTSDAIDSGLSSSPVSVAAEGRKGSLKVKKVEEGKKVRMRMSVPGPKDLWRARKKASAVGMDAEEPRRDATTLASDSDSLNRTKSEALSPTRGDNMGIIFPTSRSLSFSSPSPSEKQHAKTRVGKGDAVHQNQHHDLVDGIGRDSNLRAASGSVISLTHSDDEDSEHDNNSDEESIDLDSDSMRQLLAANTSANAAMHSNLDVNKIGMGRQVVVPPTKKKSMNRLKESERVRTRSGLDVGMDWMLELGRTEKGASPLERKASQLLDAASGILRARTKSESAVRALDAESSMSKKAPAVSGFEDWTLSLPLPSPREWERSRRVSELGASMGLASTPGGKSTERHQASHRHSTEPTASKRHTLDQKKRRASHHPLARSDDVDSGVDLDVNRGDDEPSESDEDDLRTPPSTMHVAQSFVVPRVVSSVDALEMGDAPKREVLGDRLVDEEVQVLELQTEPVSGVSLEMEEPEEDIHTKRARSNLAKLDALSADLKRFNELLRGGLPTSRKGDVNLRSVSSHKGLQIPDLNPPSSPTRLKHVRSCEPFGSIEPVESQSPPKNAVLRTSCANLRESVLASLPAPDNELGNDEDGDEGDSSDLSMSTLKNRRSSQSSMKRQSQTRLSTSSKGRPSLSPVIQSPVAAEEDIQFSSIDVMNVESSPTGYAANAVFGPSRWGKSSSLGRSGLPGQTRTPTRTPLPFAPPVGEPNAVTPPTATPPNATVERRPKKLSDGIADISPTLRNAVSSIELGRKVPISIPVQPIPTPAPKRLAVPPNLSVQISPMRRSSIILSDMTPTSATSSVFPTPLASSFPIPPTTLPSVPLDLELGAMRMAQMVPPTPPVPVQDTRPPKTQQGRPSTSSSTASTITASVAQRMKERLEQLGKGGAKSAQSVPAAVAEIEADTDESSLCSGAYYSARSSFSEHGNDA